MGGTVDPKTGEVVWNFRVPLEEQRVFYASHPPNALTGLTCTPVGTLDWPFDGHGDPVNAISEVACRCGGKLFYAGAWFEEQTGGEGAPRSPISITCDACDADYDVFDASKHGYDAAGHVPNDDEGVFPDD